MRLSYPRYLVAFAALVINISFVQATFARGNPDRGCEITAGKSDHGAGRRADCRQRQFAIRL